MNGDRRERLSQKTPCIGSYAAAGCSARMCAGTLRRSHTIPTGCPGCRLRTSAFAFSFSSCARQLHSSRPIALHRSISTVPRIILNQSLISCYSSPVFRKLQPRRPPLFSFIGKVPIRSGPPSFSFIADVPIKDPDPVGTVSESPSTVPTVAHMPPSRHTRARDEKQPLLSSSKIRPYKSPSHRDARKSFRMRSYENCRVSPAISRSFFSQRSLQDRPSALSLLCFHALTNCPFCNPFVLKFLHVMGGWRGCCVSFNVGAFRTQRLS